MLSKSDTTTNLWECSSTLFRNFSVTGFYQSSKVLPPILSLIIMVIRPARHCSQRLIYFSIYFSVPKISTAKTCIMRPFVHHPYIHWDCCPSQIEKSEYRVRRGWHGHCPILQSFRHCDRPTATTY